MRRHSRQFVRQRVEDAVELGVHRVSLGEVALASFNKRQMTNSKANQGLA